MTTRTNSLVILTLVLTLCMVGCSSSEDASTPDASLPTTNTVAGGPGAAAPASAGTPAALETFPTIENVNPQINMQPEVLIVTSVGNIRVRLDAEKAPVAVDNFLRNYVDQQFYEGTIFHYVDNGFMAAAGGYTADMQPKATQPAILNEAENGLKNVRGAIAMARHPDYRNTATSQFFINLADNPTLDHQSRDSDAEYGYCVFGKVVEGMDVVDQIAAVPVHDLPQFPSIPVTPVVIESIRTVK